MTVVSSMEFVSNQDKYFDLALDGDVCIKRGTNIFHLVNGNSFENHIIFEPDEEFYSCLSPDEFRKRVREGIHKIFENK